MSQSNQPPNDSAQPHPLVRIAMLEEKVARLEQRLAKLENSPNTQSPKLQDTAPISSLEEHAPLFEILKVDAKITESNNTWSKFAWKLILKSLSKTPFSFHATVEFLDKDGFVVADSLQPNLLLRPRSEQTFIGYELIDDSVVRSIHTIQAKVRLA